MDSPDKLQELSAFLLDRQVRGDATWVGMSSNAMIAVALTDEDYPPALAMDESDLSRCEKTYERAPAWLQELMLPTLELNRRAAAEKGLHCRSCDTFGHGGTIGNRCRSCDPEAFEANDKWLRDMLERRATPAQERGTDAQAS